MLYVFCVKFCDLLCGQKVTKEPQKGEGISMSPLPFETLTLETTKGKGFDPFLWKLFPGSFGNYPIAVGGAERRLRGMACWGTPWDLISAGSGDPALRRGEDCGGTHGCRPTKAGDHKGRPYGRRLCGRTESSAPTKRSGDPPYDARGRCGHRPLREVCGTVGTSAPTEGFYAYRRN